MKKLLLIPLLLLFATLATWGQSTTVSGQVIDTNGVPYSSATLSVRLTPTITGSLNPPTISGQPIKYNYQTFLDTSGNIPAGFTIGDNSFMLPANGWQWVFTVAEQGLPPPIGKGPQTFSVTITISGASQAIGATLSAAAPALTITLGGSGGSPAFSAILTGINTGATMTLGTGSSLNVSGTGTNNATSLLGNNWASPAALGSITPAAATLTVLIANTSFKLNGGTVMTGTQGTDTNLLSSSTISASPSIPLCTDANGGATTTSCPAAGAGTVTSVTFTGDGIVLSSTPSAACTSSCTVTATIIQPAASQLFGNPTAGSANPQYFGINAPLAFVSNKLGLTCLAGQLMGGATPACTATPSLGTGGSVNGTLTFASTGGASGAITLTPTSVSAATNLTLPSGTAVIATSLTAPSTIFSVVATNTSGVIALNYATGQTADQVLGTCNGATTISLCPLVAADLPSAIPLNQISGAAAQATATETAAGHNFTLAGVETTVANFAYVIQNTSTVNNASGALIVNAAGSGTQQIPLLVNGVSTTNFLLEVLSGATVTNGAFSGGTQEFTVSAAGNGAFNGNLTAGSGFSWTGGTTTLSLGAAPAITTSSGGLTLNTGATNTVILLQPLSGTSSLTEVRPGAAGAVGFQVRGLATQTGHLQEWANNTPTVVAFMEVTGIETDVITQDTTGTQVITGADYTNSTVTPSTVFSWTLPATQAAKNYTYRCNLLWESTNTTLVGPVFGVNISAAPTQLTANAAVQNALAGTDVNGYLSNNTTGSQTLVTSTAAGVTSTNYWALIWGTIEASPTAGATFIINAAATSGTTATLNIRRGSSCYLN